MSVTLLEHKYDAPRSHFRLLRLCEWAGFAYGDFEHKVYEYGLPDISNQTILSMGPRATEAVGVRGALLACRGYIWNGPAPGCRVVPTVGPGYIQRGNAKYSAAFINDLKKAVEVDRSGVPPQYLSYHLDPSPLAAYRWAQDYCDYLREHPDTYLAFDIETPGKGEDEEELDADSDTPDRTWHIDRIGFSYSPYKALSIPWSPEYTAAIKLALNSVGPKVVWNAGFDVPRVRRQGISINGIIHDGMVAWHILHTDLPKKLGFVATFTCPYQPAWKHLSGAKPAFYNATDADVELRSMLSIEAELKRTGLWDVYQKDVLDLEPILEHMQRKGMPVDLGVRVDRAVKLSVMLTDVRVQMEAATPLETRAIAIVYKNEPKDTTGLCSRPGTRMVSTCPGCGLDRPRKDHFKTFKKKHNPCSGLEAQMVERGVVEYYRLGEFTPSRDQLIRYHKHLNRPCPLTYDKKSRKQKISFAEKQLKELILKYPDDILYKLILEYRALDKLAGTYIGRATEE